VRAAVSMDAGPRPPDDDHEKFVPLTPFEAFVESRRQAFDAMIWQVPGLSIAAQAFLYVVALDPGSSDWVRIFAGTLGVVAALATIQLLVKHRYHEETYSETIDASRRARGVPPFRGVEWFKETALQDLEAVDEEIGELPPYVSRYREGSWRRKVAKPSSVGVWTLTLALFAVGDALIVVGAILDRACVLHPFS
jgi:hypothetical protein